MVQYQSRPIFTPAAKIQSALYSIGKEYMFAETLEEYIGSYHIYPNGAIYSGAHFYIDTSKPIVPYVEQHIPIEVIDAQGNATGTTTLNNSMYYRMTETRFNNYYTPPYHYPEPVLASYDIGYFPRFFAQRINDINDITEITPDEFDRKNSDNAPGIDDGLYKFLRLEWTIDGPIDDVRAANQRVIEAAERGDPLAERDNTFKGLQRYLSDLDEFHRNRHKQPE